MHVSRSINIGGLDIGGQFPVRVQSMTNTPTLDIAATVEQCIRLAEAGCELIRIAAPGVAEAGALPAIRKGLSLAGYSLPLIADIHFNPKAAEEAAKQADKVRINPGNYFERRYKPTGLSPESEREALLEGSIKKLRPLTDICRLHGTAIRIGVNHGSLSERILYHYGNTPEGMVASLLEFTEAFRRLDFHNLVLSVKSSSAAATVKSNIMLARRLAEVGYDYPIHLGVTEAGEGEDGIIRSSAGIGTLLGCGIGDTIRVSLTGDPVDEIAPARALAGLYQRPQSDPILMKYLGAPSREAAPGRRPRAFTWQELQESGFQIIDCDRPDPDTLSGCGEGAAGIAVKVGENSRLSEILPLVSELRTARPEAEIVIAQLFPAPITDAALSLQAAAGLAPFLLGRITDSICIVQNERSAGTLRGLSLNILQATGLLYTRPEYISCPTCGRTEYDVQGLLQEVKASTGHLAGLRIAVMGCIVNGPGEMGEADYGCVGTGGGMVSIYKGNKAILRKVPREKALDALIRIITEHGDWRNP